MRKHTWKWVLTASALSFLAPASTVVAGDQVPIKGNLTIVTGPPISFIPPILTQYRFVTGNVSHLGNCTGRVVDHLDLTFFPSPLGFVDDFTLTAANGDTITGVGTGKLVLNGATGFYDFTEAIVITGGTGRFAGATGSATAVGQADPTSGLTHESLEGTISSPGSLK
jgi:hypothetical protein